MQTNIEEKKSKRKKPKRKLKMQEKKLKVELIKVHSSSLPGGIGNKGNVIRT